MQRHLILSISTCFLVSACADSQTQGGMVNPEMQRQIREYDRQMQVVEAQAKRADDQQARMEVLIQRWESQADRYDAILSRWEKQAPGK